MRLLHLPIGVSLLAVCLSVPLAAQSESLDNAPAESAGLKNPYQGDSNHVRAGAKLFRQSCASCHGEAATGKGKNPSLRTERISQAPPGALFWFIRAGAAKKGMPSFNRLPQQRIWQIVTFLQASPAPAH
ncbi:MAG: cytochrome c [Acidobacteriota bacterium]